MSESEVVEVPPSLARRYQPLRVLGLGGFGVVLLARDGELDRQVALKLMAKDVFQDATHRRRFLREAKVASKVRSHHVAEVYDVGQADGVPYLAMRFVPGVDLRERLAECAGRLEHAEADRVMEGILEGLAACHREGLVHRDLKPENVLLGPDGEAVLVDFGLARGEESRVTATGVVLGTMGYLPPEVAVGSEFQPAGDVFAAACVYYELRTGVLPYGDGPPVPGSPACEGLQHGLRSHGLAVAPELEALVKRCLDPQPAARPRDGEEMLEEFRAATKADQEASQLGSHQTSRIAPKALRRTSHASAVPVAVTQQSNSKPPSRASPAGPGGTLPRKVHPAMAVLLLAAGLGLGLVLARRGDGPRPRPGHPPSPPGNPAADPETSAIHTLEAALLRLASNPSVQAALALEERPADQLPPPRERWEIWSVGNTAFWEVVVTPELREACVALRGTPLTPELGTLVHRLLQAQYLLTRSENALVRPAYGMEERSGLRTLGARFLDVHTVEHLLVDEVQEGRISLDQFRDRRRLVAGAAHELGGRWEVRRGAEELFSKEEGIGFMPRLRIVTPLGRKWLTPMELGGAATEIFASEELQGRWFRRTEELAPTAIRVPLEPPRGDLDLLVSLRGWHVAVYGRLRVVGAGGEEVVLVFPSEDDGKIPGAAQPTKYYLRRLQVFAGALPPAPRMVELSAFGIQVVANPEPATNVGLILQRVGH